MNGPVAVELGDIGHMCFAAGYPSERGCVVRNAKGQVAIYCRDQSRAELAECLAHEIRHVVEPEWQHLERRARP